MIGTNGGVRVFRHRQLSLADPGAWPRQRSRVSVTGQHELDHRDLGHRPQVVPEAVDGLFLGVAELLDDQGIRVGAVRPLTLGRLDEHPNQELARLDLRIVPVLQNFDPLHGRAGEPVPG
jgi:hypothetical protein